MPIIRDTKIETQQIRDLLSALKEGETLEYKTIMDSVGVDPQGKSRHLVDTAKKHAEEKCGCVYVAIPGVGLKRVDQAGEIDEFNRKAASIRRKARRNFRRSEVVDFERMTQENKLRLTAIRTIYAVVAEAGSEKSIKKIEKASSDFQVKSLRQAVELLR